MSNNNALKAFPIELGQEVVFREDWRERDIFDYAIYKVTSIKKSRSTCTVVEVKSGDLYDQIKLTELRPLVLN